MSHGLVSVTFRSRYADGNRSAVAAADVNSLFQAVPGRPFTAPDAQQAGAPGCDDRLARPAAMTSGSWPRRASCPVTRIAVLATPLTSGGKDSPTYAVRMPSYSPARLPRRAQGPDMKANSR